MDFFNVVSYNKAQELIINAYKECALNYESIDYDKCLNRVLYEHVTSSINLPSFRRSTVDGYAIIASDSNGACESIASILRITGSVKMGERADISISRGQAVAVATGAMLPEGADSVVMIEHTELIGDMLGVLKPIATGENTVDVGEDIEKGQVVLNKGTRLTPYNIGVMAAMGVNCVKAFKKPRVSIISTGDELISSDKDNFIGKIRDINTPMLSAMAEQAGFIVVNRCIIEDDLDYLTEAIESAADISDIIIISGGSSVGERDYTCKAIENNNGEIFIKGIAIKPGKPTIVGRIKNKLVYGLAGHPMAAAVTFMLFVKDCYNKAIGNTDSYNTLDCVMTSNFPSSSGRTTIVLVNIDKKDNKYYATPIFCKSGHISPISRAQGFIMIDETCEGVYKDSIMEVYLLN